MALGGKKRGSVVHGDWYVIQRRGRPPETVPAYKYGPPYITDGTVDEVRGWGLRLPDGRWKLQPSRAAAKREYAERASLADTRYEWAERTERLVRKALKRHKPRRVKARTIDENVKSSFLYPGRATGWIEPDPFHVLVFTEGANLRDPWNNPDVLDMFNKAAEEIRADAWYDDAGWENYNAAVSYFWVQPKMIA